MSLFDILRTTELAVVGDHLRTNYVESKEETERRAHAALLDDFYDGGGDVEMHRVIGICWKDQKNQDRRKAFIDAGLDKWNNVIARAAHEKATVYSEPPRRKIANNDERYQQFLELVQMDDAMAEVDRKLAYHEDVWVQYRVRLKPNGEREPLLDVVTPASFWAVHHPGDRTLLVAIVLDQRMPLTKPTDPSFRVWSDDQTFTMNGKCEIFESSIEAWPFNRMPGVLATTRKPGTKSTLLAKRPAADLLSAQKAVRLQDVSLSKESVSAGKQLAVSGDGSAATMGQQNDTDAEIFVGDATVQSIERGMDPTLFRDNSESIVDAAFSNHGIPPSVRKQQDASSGAEIQLRRIPIREIRQRRIPVMRRIELELAKVMAMVNSARLATVVDPETKQIVRVAVAGDLEVFAFSAEGWSIDFGEIQQPLTEQERDDIYENRKRLGLTDPYEEEMRRNPDLKTYAQAKAVIDERNKRLTEHVKGQKDLMAMNGSASSTIGEPTAQQNGAAGGAASAQLRAVGVQQKP